MRLKPEYQELLYEYEDNYNGCYCSATNYPPCSSCTHEGNPDNLENNPDAWCRREELLNEI